MKQFAGAILGVAVGASVAYLAIPEQPAQPPASHAPQQASADAERLTALEARQQRFEAELDRLKARTHEGQQGVPGNAAARTAFEATIPPDVMAMFSALENRIESLRAELGATRFPAATNPEEFRIALNTAIQRTEDDRYVRALARIPLRERYLAEWPRDLSAKHHLSELVGDFRWIMQPEKAMAAIDRFGPRTDFTPPELDQLRLQAASTEAQRIEIARRLERTSRDVGCRAWALYELSNALARLGRTDEAIRVLEVLIAEVGGMPAGTNYVGNAARLRDKLRAGK